MTSPAPSTVNPPKQTRSRRTLERIVAASLEILATEGPGALTGISARSLEWENPHSDRTELDLADIQSSLRAVMWRNVGIERRGERLSETLEIVNFWGRYMLDKEFNFCWIGNCPQQCRHAPVVRGVRIGVVLQEHFQAGTTSVQGGNHQRSRAVGSAKISRSALL